MIGPFQSIKYFFSIHFISSQLSFYLSRYVIFKFGLQYITLTNCSNNILFEYSYDNGIQWFTKRILDQTDNIFENFDDLKINTNIYLRWIEETNHSCLMWNLRSISIRTKDDQNFWFDNQTNSEYQTWEYFLLHPSSIIQFSLQMFPIKKTNNTNWELALEISSDMNNGWSNWLPLIPSCNQTNLYCEDRISSTGSIFLGQLFEKERKLIVPIPDSYV